MMPPHTNYQTTDAIDTRTLSVHICTIYSHHFDTKKMVTLEARIHSDVDVIDGVQPGGQWDRGPGSVTLRCQGLWIISLR